MLSSRLNRRGAVPRRKFARLKTRAILAGAAPALGAGFGFGFCRRGRCAEWTRIDPPRRECERGVATESPSPLLGTSRRVRLENGNVWRVPHRRTEPAAAEIPTIDEENAIPRTDISRDRLYSSRSDLIFFLSLSLFSSGGGQPTSRRGKIQARVREIGAGRNGASLSARYAASLIIGRVLSDFIPPL